MLGTASCSLITLMSTVTTTASVTAFLSVASGIDDSLTLFLSSLQGEGVAVSEVEVENEVEVEDEVENGRLRAFNSN